MSKIKIAIADDYKVYRDGLKVSLSADETLIVVAEAGNGEELLKELEIHPTDVILMDLKMPVMDGMEATKAVRKKYPLIKILVITMYGDEKFITHMKEIGAHGYLLKNAESEELRKAIHSVYKEGYYFNEPIA